MAISGQSILLGANAPNFGTMYVMLDEFHHHRAKSGLTADAIADGLKSEFDSRIADGLNQCVRCPRRSTDSALPVDIKIVIEDRGDNGLTTLEDVSQQIAMTPVKIPDCAVCSQVFRADTPWLYLDIDRSAAKSMGVFHGATCSTHFRFISARST